MVCRLLRERTELRRSMPQWKFGKWAPDQSPFGNPGVVRATNVIPAADGYDPARQYSVATTELAERPLGARAAISAAGTAFQYVGTATGLHVNIGGTWTERTRDDGLGGFDPYAATDFWDFAQWRDLLIAVNKFDEPQIVTLGASNQFDDLVTTGWPFKAKFVTTIKGHVVMANLDDTSDPVSAQRPSRVKWSGFNDHESWVPDTATLSDYEDLGSQKIQRIFGGEYGVVFQETSIWRMTYIGAPAVFQFDETVPGVGLIAPGACAQVGDTIYFWSAKGFFALTAGSQLDAIGAEFVDDFLKRDLDSNYLSKISAAADPRTHHVHFLYVGSDNQGGEPNRRAVYDTTTGNWSVVDEELSLLWSTQGIGVDLDSAEAPGDPLDLDDPEEVSFDDPRWIGDSKALAAFGPDFASGFFDGANLTGEIETAEIAFNPNGRSMLTRFRPLIEGGTITARVGVRNSLNDAVSFGPTVSMRNDGSMVTRNNARYHRVRFFLADDWDHAIGWEAEPRDIRRVEGRG